MEFRIWSLPYALDHHRPHRSHVLHWTRSLVCIHLGREGRSVRRHRTAEAQDDG